MPREILQHAVKTALIMILFAIAGTAMLAFVYDLTKTPIAESEAQARMALFRQIVPDHLHDNDLLEDVIEIAPDPLLGKRSVSHAYRARLDGKPAGVILEAIAPDGYSGDIKLLIAIREDGVISGVRVLAHKETPGLGDYIDITHGNWIRQFDTKSLEAMPEQAWKVRKDGGQFDYMAGATITPRAVIKAVHQALLYFVLHRDVLFSDSSSEVEVPRVLEETT